MGPDSQIWGRSDPQLPQVWVNETLARADEVLSWTLSLATACPSVNVYPCLTHTHLKAHYSPLHRVDLWSPWHGNSGKLPGDQPLLKAVAFLFPVAQRASFLPVVHVIFLWFPHTAPDR